MADLNSLHKEEEELVFFLSSLPQMRANLAAQAQDAARAAINSGAAQSLVYNQTNNANQQLSNQEESARKRLQQIQEEIMKFQDNVNVIPDNPTLPLTKTDITTKQNNIPLLIISSIVALILLK